MFYSAMSNTATRCGGFAVCACVGAKPYMCVKVCVR